ncbi:hypothetical protein DFA_05986 [Cavenderia fasciculata]|uniref:Uncharacterized protein n=1 Tax=Cavenderia fasciculata TaxID=261658 RepID=F4PJS6_CACFS|nr:uncharacterized protein DFA_05986 [Cavenderia fasciculata]EGG23850.1 hypothetical protein DFA_05986 [Cavenderia fasciculata]|eukprot:XP_004361701.1 hypothetical protein DFA_05986 [Cavenderia fasciculata]
MSTKFPLTGIEYLELLNIFNLSGKVSINDQDINVINEIDLISKDVQDGELHLVCQESDSLDSLISSCYSPFSEYQYRKTKNGVWKQTQISKVQMADGYLLGYQRCFTLVGGESYLKMWEFSTPSIYNKSQGDNTMVLRHYIYDQPLYVRQRPRPMSISFPASAPVNQKHNLPSYYHPHQQQQPPTNEIMVPLANTTLTSGKSTKKNRSSKLIHPPDLHSIFKLLHGTKA